MTRALTAVLGTATLLLLAPLPAHAQQKTTTRNPHGPSLKEPCASCHSAVAWKPTKLSGAFKHAPKIFPLMGAHENTKCMACHTSLDFKGTSGKCISCHKDVHNGELGADCARCHTMRTFVDRSQMLQFHQLTRFPLTGAHVVVDCLVCHPPVAQGHMSFVNRPTECAACHLPAYNATTNPSHVASGFPTTCNDCHTTISWTTQTFDHSKTNFPLTGAHLATTCAQCHGDGVYKGKSTLCVSCHLDKYNATSSPPHVAAGFPTTCENCHNTNVWLGATFDHNAPPFTFFLTGNHTAPPRTCDNCHNSGVYKGLVQTCVSCHKPDYDLTTSTVVPGIPPHAAAGFATSCTDCHGSAYLTWTGGNYNHNAAPNTFPLTGAHVTTTCAQCHTGSQYRGMSALCYSCHKPDYDKTATAGAYPDNPPPHSTAGFPTTCESCHSTTTFVTTAFTHSGAPFTFSLAGLHKVPPRACTDCHTGTIFKGLPQTCVSCHLLDYNNTTATPVPGVPPHAANGLGTTCETCHGTAIASWTGGTYNHNVAPNTFPLTGTHVTTTCVQCHTGTVYRGLSMLCYSCHKPDYDKTSVAGSYPDNPPAHATAGFPTNCESCHSTTTFVTTAFTHSGAPFTFSLAGLHKVPPRACTDCHTGTVFKGLPQTCVSCHLLEYNNTTSTPLPGVPPHAGNGFATTCETCHGTTIANWLNATYNHNAAPNTFPLTGTHVTTTCAQCHTGTVYRGLSALCYSCHKTDYDNTSVAGKYADNPPPHMATGFPTNCESCHNTTTFVTAAFTHSGAPFLFSLNGLHKDPPRVCSDCHKPGVAYIGLSMLCYSCHKIDYDKTTSTPVPGVPPHAGNSFATTCETCHGTSIASWVGGTYNHNAAPNTFPLTGTHVTTTCALCHTGTVYRGLSVLCYSCHKTDYDNTSVAGKYADNPPPHMATGFPTNCESCHNTTSFVTAAFTHSGGTFTFTLAGLHKDPPRVCSDCHSSGVYKGLSTLCYSCHKPDYDKTTTTPIAGVPPHAGNSFATTCETCHGTTIASWLNATYNHNAAPNTFPLTGTHVTTTCVQCHTGAVYHGLSVLCYSCHQTDYNNTSIAGKYPDNPPPHMATGFPTTCESCHNTTTWTGASVNHNAAPFTFFLTGMHTVPPRTCNDCHSSGVYKGLNSACYPCHKVTYDSTSNPPHASVSFNTTCSACHASTTTWAGATLTSTSHTWFNPGHHGSSCAQCHPSPSYLTFSCRGCHGDTHKKGYTDAQCWSCHKKG